MIIIKPVKKQTQILPFTDAEYAHYRQTLITQGVITPDSDNLREGERPFLSAEGVQVLRQRLIKSKFLTPKAKKVFLSS